MSRGRARAARRVTLARLEATDTGELIRQRALAAVRGAAAALAAVGPPMRAGRVPPNRAATVAALCDGLRVACSAALADLDDEGGGRG